MRKTNICKKLRLSMQGGSVEGISFPELSLFDKIFCSKRDVICSHPFIDYWPDMLVRFSCIVWAVHALFCSLHNTVFTSLAVYALILLFALSNTVFSSSEVLLFKILLLNNCISCFSLFAWLFWWLVFAFICLPLWWWPQSSCFAISLCLFLQ